MKTRCFASLGICALRPMALSVRTGSYLRIRSFLPFFSLGRRRPKPVPRDKVPLHSAGLPGRVKKILASFAREDIFYFTATGNLFTLYISYLETLCGLETRTWKRRCIGIIQQVSLLPVVVRRNRSHRT